MVPDKVGWWEYIKQNETVARVVVKKEGGSFLAILYDKGGIGCLFESCYDIENPKHWGKYLGLIDPKPEPEADYLAALKKSEYSFPFRKKQEQKRQPIFWKE